jgi:hypothetical protein
VDKGEPTPKSASQSGLKDLRTYQRLLAALLCLWGLIGAVRLRLLPDNVSAIMMTTLALITVLMLGPAKDSELRPDAIALTGCFGAETYLLIRTMHPLLAAVSGYFCLISFLGILATFVELGKLRKWVSPRVAHVPGEQSEFSRR